MANTARIPLSSVLRSASEIPPKFEALNVPALPPLHNALARGIITEITGRRSSGRTAALIHILAQATGRGEVCAVIDANDAFHPASAASAGVELSRLVWVRCRGNAVHALRATDLLLHAGGFGVVVLDLCETPAPALNQIPMSYWHRFRQTIDNTPTTLVVCTAAIQTKAAAHRIEVEPQAPLWIGAMPFGFLQGLQVAARTRKPVEGAAHRLTLDIS